jgi:prepilin-type processing-associated H-X9-DG protein
MYTFTNLTNARSFVARTNKPHFIFAAPTSGFIVVDARTANQLWADGHQDIK